MTPPSGWSHTVTKSLSGAVRSSAEVIAEAPCCTASGGILPLAHFSPVTFTSATVNGSAIGNFSPTQITMVDSSGRGQGLGLRAHRTQQIHGHLAAKQLTA